MKKTVTTQGKAELQTSLLRVQYTKTVTDRIELSFDVGMDANDYVFFPAAVYGGNKGSVRYVAYPPAFDPKTEHFGRVMPPAVTDVPRLENDGSGAVELTSGDVSVPCVGVFPPFVQARVFRVDGTAGARRKSRPRVRGRRGHAQLPAAPPAAGYFYKKARSGRAFFSLTYKFFQRGP